MKERAFARKKRGSYHLDEFVPEQNMVVRLFFHRHWHDCSILCRRGDACRQEEQKNPSDFHVRLQLTPVRDRDGLRLVTQSSQCGHNSRGVYSCCNRSVVRHPANAVVVVVSDARVFPVCGGARALHPFHRPLDDDRARDQRDHR